MLSLLGSPFTARDSGKKRRVLFVSYTAEHSGPTHSLQLLLRHLRKRFDVAVLLPGQGPFCESLRRDQIPFFSLPRLDKRALLDVIRLIRSEGFSLVYANSNDSSSRMALIAAKLAGIPVICHVRSMATGKPWLRSAYLNFADAVIAVSHSCAAALRGKVLMRKLNVIHNGIDLDVLPDTHPAGASLRQRWGIPSERVVLINVGHLMPRKGQEFALRAVAAALRGGADVELLLVGSQERDRRYVEATKTLIRELDLESRVHLVGFSNNVPDLLSAGEIYLHTAINDPHPRAVLEAMAAGLPVIAFGVDGIAETVVDRKSGFLIPCCDVAALAGAIQKLTENPSLRIQMGVEGRRQVESHFLASTTAERVARTIETHIPS